MAEFNRLQSSRSFLRNSLRVSPNRLINASVSGWAVGEVLPLRNQTLMNRTGQKGDAVPAHLITEVLASHADPGGAGRSKDIYFQIIPLLSGNGINSRHRSQASTSALLASPQEVKAGQKPPSPPLPGEQPTAVALKTLYADRGLDQENSEKGLMQLPDYLRSSITS